MVDLISDEVRVNIFTDNDQEAMHLAALTGGGYVAVWQSDDQNGSGTGLTAQLYNSFGERTGLPFFIEENTVSNQTIGGVAGTADGGFVVTWQVASTTEIRARQFDANGSPAAAEFIVNTEDYSTQAAPEVAGLSGGGFVVTWSSLNDETFTYDIRAQRYDAGGAAQGAEFTVNTTTAGTQTVPEIAALQDGGFVVIWEDRSGNDGSSHGIFGQRYNAAGVAQGAEFVVNTTTAGQQGEPDVVALGGGGFVVVWTDFNGADGSVYGVYGQIYNAAGATVGSEFLVNQTTASYQFESAVTATPDGGFYVAWYAYGTANGTTYDIVGRHFDASGTALTDELIINDDMGGSDPRRPDVIALSNGAIVVGWDYPPASGDGDGRAVYQRLLELDGSEITLPEKPILEAFDPSVNFTESELQSAPQILDASGAVAVSGPADFDGGRLTVSRITAIIDQVQFNRTAGLDDDSLGVRDQGTGAGQIGVSGTSVTFGGVVIGTITSDGTNGQPLVITFNTDADRQAVEAVAENLTYQNNSDDPATTVELALLLEDGNGAASEPVRVTVTVTPEVDAPQPVFENDIEVNTFTFSTQQQPEVAALTDGGWVVMWESYSQDTSSANNYGIVGQRYDSSGAPVGAEFLVNTQVQGSQTTVDVASITGGPNAGGFVAVWHDPNNATDGYVRAQIFDASSAPVGGEIMVPTTVYSTQYQPRVTSFADGGFAVVWSSYEQATNSYDIKVQRFDAAGAKLGNESIAHTVTASTQRQPDITALAGGGFAVVWESYDSGGTNTYEIATRVFNASGVAVSGEVQVNTATAGGQAIPRVAALTGGDYVVVWEDQAGLDGNSYGVYAQLMSATGAPVGTQFLVNEITQGFQGEPVVTPLDDGGFAVAYYTTASVFNGSYNIAIQHYDASGNRVDGEILVNQDTSSSQYQPSIATLTNGDTVLVYRDDSGRDGSGAGIVMQIVGDAANYAGAANNPVISIAQATVVFDEADVNAAPQLLFAGVDVGDADSADFDGGMLSIFRAGATQAETLFGEPDDDCQDNLGIRDQGTGAGQIGVSGTSVTFGGTAIATITSDGADGAALTFSLNAAATPAAIEALLQNVTYANPSDDPEAARQFRVVLTDGDDGTALPVNIQVQITEDNEGFVPLSPELQVNSFEESTQDQPDVGALASGGYVAVWRSYDQDAGTFDYGVYGQRFDATGQPLGDEFQVNTFPAGSQQDPQVTGIATADGGGFVVAWYDSSNNAGYIKARVFNDDGTERAAEFMVETEVYSNQYAPAVTAVPGGFLVTWSSFNNETFSYDIRGQFFNGSGAAQGSEFTVNTTLTAGTQDNSDVAVDGSGNAVVVWQDQSGQDGSGYGVYGQRIDSTGALVGSEFQVNTTTQGSQYLPQVDYLSDGRFVVAWYDDFLDGSGAGVFAQLFAADATPIGTEFLVNEVTSNTQQIRDVLGLSDGGFAIAFDDSNSTDGSGWGVFVQQYNADGSRRDGALQINQEISSTQNQVRITEISDGVNTGIAAVWSSASSGSAGDGSGAGVFTRVLGTSGTLQPANVIPEVENLDRFVDYDVATIATAQLIDNSFELSDPDSGDFAGGSVEVKYTDYRANADDQLNVLAGKGITTSGADVLYDGTVIGVVDATDNGVNGADLVINLNASATPANVRYLLEQLGYASSSPVTNSERNVSIRVSDGDGGLSEGDGIRIDIESSVSAVGITLGDVDDLSATEAEVEAGVRLDPSVDFDYGLTNGFDGGFVDLGYRTGPASRTGAVFETLSVADDGTGTNQIGVSGSDISFEGTAIGSIDPTLDGQAGSDLRINLLAAATPEAIDALIEAFTYRNNSDGPPTEVRFDLRVTDALGSSTGDRDFEVTITPEIDGATVPLGGEMQVNGFTESTQTNPAISELADGGFVVTWQSYNQDSSFGFDYGVYQQRYTAAGEPVGPEVLVNQTTTGNQDLPDVAGLTGGGWVAVWEGSDVSGVGIQARIFDASGTPGAEFQVNLQESSTQDLPKVAALANGNFVVTWVSNTSAGAGDGSAQGVIGRVFTAAGVPVTAGDIVLNTFTTSTQRDVDVAGLTGGGFVAVWESFNVDGDSYGVAFQRFDNDGVPVGAETVVNTTVAGSQDTPSVAELTDGGFVIAWQSPDASGDGIYLQRYDANGAAVGDEVQVNDFESSTQGVPDVAGTTDGGWMVVWSDASGRDGSGTGVVAQRYDAAGNRVDGSFVVNEEISSTQNQGVVATLSDGRVVFAWGSNTSATAGDGSGAGIFVRLFGTEAQAQSGDPVVGGIADVTLDEADLNAGYTQVFPGGSVAVADPDSADFDGGRLMVHVVRDYAAAEQFATPDNLQQDVMTFAGTGISIAGSTVSVGGIVIGMLEADGQAGVGLQVLLNANATAERVETLLSGLSYRNPSNDPQDTREIEVTLSDGDGGVTDHQTFTVTITPEQDGFERIGTEQRVNSFTASTQYQSDVAGLTGGGHVVAWASRNQDNPGDNDYGIFAQRYDVDGQPIGPEFQVNTTFDSSQNQPAVVGLSDGSFVVAWEGSGVGDTSGVFGQRFAADGSPLGAEFRINETTSSSDADVRLAAAADGGFMAVWYSSTGTEVQARIYNASGAAIGSEFTVNAAVSGTQSEPDVAALAGGGYAVAWRDSTSQDVITRVVDATGGFVSSETTVNTNNPVGTQYEPAIAGLSGGGYVVTWTDNSALDGSSNGTYAQIYSASGVAQGVPFLVNETVNGSQYEGRVVGTPDGGFVVVYRDNSDILAQQFDANGNRVDGQIIVNTETASTQDDPAVDVLANGGIVVSWTSNTSGTAGDGSGDGVFSQIFGDPADFNLEGRPVLQGVNETVTYLENALNVGPQLLDANNAVALSDTDSADFDGGFLRVDNVIVTRGYQDQVAPPDNFTQDNLGLRQAQGITITGGDVFVNATQVGTITETGVAGDPFAIALNGNATVAIVELLVENLTYRNTSDDPEASRVVRVQVGDGDGGVSDPSLVAINITPEVDGAAPVFGERQANTETQGEQSQGDVATLDDGGFVIVWRSYDQDAASTYGVYGQRFDANGNAVGDEFLVNSTVASSQYEPAVTGLQTGGWVVTWRDDSGSDGRSSGVFMQRYATDGSTAGAETQVNTYFNSVQYQPAVTLLANGDYVVTWTSFNNTAAGGSSYDVFAQVYQSDGTAIGGEFLVNSEVSATQDQPDVTALTNGGFAIAWESATSGTAGDGSSNGVFYQVFSDSTTNYAAVGGELQANSYTTSAQGTPSIAGLTGGGHVIVWESNGQDGSGEGVFAQQYDAAGLPVGQEFRVNDQRINSQSQPDVAALSNGGYVVVYSDNNGTDGSGVGVYAQQFAANGNRIDGALQVNTETSSTQDQPAVAALDDGGFVVSWTSRTSATAGDGSGDGIFYQVFSNTAPVVTDISATTAEDASLVFSSAIFAEGFEDADGQSLAEIRIDVLPSTGTLEYNGSPVAPGQVITSAELDTGALVFIPPQDFNGTADFGWSGSDGTSYAAAIALTNITVTPVNDPVDLQTIPNQTIAEGSFLSIQAQLGDPDNDTYAITVNYGEGNADVTFNSASKTPSLSNRYEAEGSYTVNLSIDDQNGSVENTSFTVTVENGPPVAGNDFYATDEDTAVSGVNLFSDDSDPGGDPFTITAINGTSYTPGDVFVLPSGATVTVSATGDLVYDPTVSPSLQALADGESTSDSFTYTITDDGLESDSATVNVNISGADDNVVAQDDVFTVDEDSVLAGSVLADNGNGADIDPEGDALTIISINGNPTLVGAPVVVSGGGVLQVNANGTLSFDTSDDYNELNVGDTRQINFSYVVEESGSNLTAGAQGVITITGVNDDPIVQDDTRSTQLNTPVNIDVISNDFDRDSGDTFSVTAVGAPTNGTAQIETDGTVTYTPGNGFSGPDSFTYEVTDDNGGTSSALVTINVQESNAPVATNDLVTTDEATPLSADVFADNGNGPDFDPEGESFSVTAVNGQAASVGTQIALSSGALLTLNAGGTFDYDPNGAFEFVAATEAANDSFDYTITDSNGGTNTAVVTVQVTGLNDAPTMTDSATNAAENGAPVNFNLATLSDDVDTDDTPASLTYAITTQPVEGGASVSGTQLNFDPGVDFQDLNEGQSRDVTIGVTATDANGAASNEGTLTVSVLGQNDDPTLVAGGLAAVEDGPAVTLDLSGLGDDADAEDDGGSLSYAIVADGAPSEGTASILGTVLSFDPGADFQDLNAGATRDVTVSVQATDARGAVSSVEDVTVTVTGVNDDPTLVAGGLAAVEDGPAVTLDLSGLGDDADAEDDGGSLSYAIVADGAPSEGTASILGTVLSFDPGADFQDLNAGATRDVTVSVQATDARGAVSSVEDVTVTVTGVNDDPTLVAGGLAAVEDGPAVTLDLSGLGDDADAEDDGGSLSYAIVADGAPSEGTASILGTVLSFDPGADFQDLNAGATRDVTVSVQATDARGAVSSVEDVTVTVTGVNDDPTLVAGGLAAVEDGPAVTLDLSGLGDDADAEDDGGSLSYAIVADGAPSEGTASILGTVLSFDPGADFQDLNAGATRDVTVSVQATDARGAVSSVEDVTVTVTGVNDDPTLVAGGLAAVEDGPAVTLDLSGLGDDADAEDDGGSLSYAIVADGAPSEGTASILGTVLSFDPGADFQDLNAGATRDVTVSVQATDARGAVSSVEDVTVTVTGVNDDPTLVAGGLAAVEDGPAVTLDLSGLGDDADAEDDGGSLSYAIVADGAPSEGTASILGTVLSFDPGADFQDLNAGATRDVTVSVQATDARGAVSSVEDVTVTVTGVNDDPTNTLPVANDDGPFAATEGALTGPLDVLANDTDPDDDELIIVGGDAFTELGGLVVNAADGSSLSVDYTGVDLADLAEGETRADSFQYVVSDGDLVDAAMVAITLTGKADDGAPELNPVIGTPGRDNLVGTVGADLIQSLGGFNDMVSGLAGADVFDFAALLTNGARDYVSVLDYEVGVNSVSGISGANIANDLSFGGNTFLQLDTDNDVIQFVGVGNVGDLAFV